MIRIVRADGSIVYIGPYNPENIPSFRYPSFFDQFDVDREDYFEKLERKRNEKQKEQNDFLHNSIVFKNILNELDKYLPTNRQKIILRFTVDPNLQYDNEKILDFIDKNNYKSEIINDLKDMQAIYDSGKYDYFEVMVRGKYYNIDYRSIIIDPRTVGCKECKSLNDVHYGSTVESFTETYGYCCRKKWSRLKTHVTSNADSDKDFFETRKEYFEKESPNKGKFILKNMYTIQCRSRHITRLRNYLSMKNMNELQKCWICEEKLDEKYEFFRLIKELGANYYIEERDKSSVNLKGLSKDLAKIAKLNVFTYNDKKHLTGKIVFDDLLGEQQAKANSNKLVFRWFELKHINDAEYCRIFFADYFQDIVNKNKLRGV